MAITRTDGFVDLRVSPTVSGRSDEDSVWPSFTDIMTVVVLIFLVALVIILMRNTELVGQLRESVSQTETMTTQRGEMEMRIAALGDEVVRLRSVLAQAEAERSAAEETIVLKESEISALLDDVSALQKVREALAGEKAQLDEELANLEALEIAGVLQGGAVVMFLGLVVWRLRGSVGLARAGVAVGAAASVVTFVLALFNRVAPGGSI